MAKRPPLTHAEIFERLRSYDADSIPVVAAVVNEHLSQQYDRASSIQARGTAILGFAATVSAALIPWLMSWATDFPSKVGLLLAAGLAIGSVVAAFRAARADMGWGRLRDVDLFPRVPEGGSPPTVLRAHWVAGVYHLAKHARAKCDEKANALLFAQWLLVASAATVGLAMGLRVIVGG